MHLFSTWECAEPMDEVDNRFGCVCLGWSTTVEVEYSLSPEMADYKVEVGEFFRHRAIF